MQPGKQYTIQFGTKPDLILTEVNSMVGLMMVANAKVILTKLLDGLDTHQARLAQKLQQNVMQFRQQYVV